VTARSSERTALIRPVPVLETTPWIYIYPSISMCESPQMYVTYGLSDRSLLGLVVAIVARMIFSGDRDANSAHSDGTTAEHYFDRPSGKYGS